MELKVFILLLIFKFANGSLRPTATSTVFDQELYESVLDPELCHEQVRFIRSNPLLTFMFADPGIRIPRGMLELNNVDLGNYHQCLGTTINMGESNIEGKYCMIRVPLNQSFHLPWNWENSESWDFNDFVMDEEVKKSMLKYNKLKSGVQALDGFIDDRSVLDNPLVDELSFRLAVCIPKSCSTQQAMTSFLFNLTAIGFQYDEEFCRLPNDKPWVAADYVAVSLLSFIGLLTLLSTSYDVFHTVIKKKDPKDVDTLCRSFSVYTNGRRLTTFTTSPNSLNCLDGIRSIAMAWVILGHTYSTDNFIANYLDTINWFFSARSLFITTAPFTVDTFFLLAGILIVYTTAGKITGVKLVKNVHLFYINRIMRVLPLLALTVLIESSIMNRVFDGPYWSSVAQRTQLCREFWWTTLLFVQNYVTGGNMCSGHSWYMAIDIQLYIVSPIILYWVLSGNKKSAWIALTCGLLAILAASTAFNVVNNFPGDSTALARGDELVDYMVWYYVNTLTRGSPFFVGMLFGYLLHLWKGNRPRIHHLIVLLLWACACVLMGLVIYLGYNVKKFDWDNQFLDNMMNSFSRPAWALCLGWLIFACVHGYSGPINWFLSLDIWRLPSRLSYAMYLLHYPLIYTINSTVIAPVFFSIGGYAFKFLAFFTLTFIVSFIAALVIDGPFSVLIKMMMGDGAEKKQKTENTTSVEYRIQA